jgi:hypothetical protein
MTLTKFGSVVSNPVSTAAPDNGFPERFSETEQLSNLLVIDFSSRRPFSNDPSRVGSNCVRRSLTYGAVSPADSESIVPRIRSR